MRCKKARILASAAIDGELSEREKRLLEQHFAECPACREEHTTLVALRKTMALWEDKEPSPWLAENFAHKLERFMAGQECPATRKPHWAIGVATAGLVATLLAFGFFLTSRPEPPSEPLSHPDKRPAIVQATKTPAKPETANSLKGQNHAATKSHPVQATVLNTREGKQHKPKVAQTIIAKRSPHPTLAEGLQSKAADKIAEEKPSEAEILHSIVAAQKSHEEASVVVASNLGVTGMTMNETLEILRGTLQKTADILAERTNSENINTAIEEGGTL
ncbi:MAG: zf-HC2 domain-containing protein [Armatimonadetes bacterium]|nr:zf-HC2 domain-containing protein [Armatimonadota bacterium]